MTMVLDVSHFTVYAEGGRAESGFQTILFIMQYHIWGNTIEVRFIMAKGCIKRSKLHGKSMREEG
jgi:hypothetical protein